MKIFLSYSSEDRRVAEEIYLALLGAGHEVFFDQNSLPPGSDYNSRIRKAIAESERFIFLISPHSVQSGGYALTELKFAKERWPKPWGAVLPVMIKPTDYDLIDKYLTATTILEPTGSVAAEVASAPERLPGWKGEGEAVGSGRNGVNNKHKIIERYLVIAFGVLFLVLLIIPAIFFPEPTEFQYFVFRVVLALAAAGTASMIPGFIEAEVSSIIRAGGAIAIFMIVFFFSPAKLVVDDVDNNGQEIVADLTEDQKRRLKDELKAAVWCREHDRPRQALEHYRNALDINEGNLEIQGEINTLQNQLGTFSEVAGETGQEPNAPLTRGELINLVQQNFNDPNFVLKNFVRKNKIAFLPTKRMIDFLNNNGVPKMITEELKSNFASRIMFRVCQFKPVNGVGNQFADELNIQFGLAKADLRNMPEALLHEKEFHPVNCGPEGPEKEELEAHTGYVLIMGRVDAQGSNPHKVTARLVFVSKVQEPMEIAKPHAWEMDTTSDSQVRVAKEIAEWSITEVEEQIR